ncbi:MAG: AAA family ATPase, partial [Desulfamplus sp.]|nr:AAA family ATPase [Desulfamplus sp.]
MKFPYGNSDFRSVILDKYYYCDRTDRIPRLEQEKYQLFLRPRRFGKSMLLSMLENYYDVAAKEQFGPLFGHLKIGKNPTRLRNSYFILKWDFSCIDASGSLKEIRQSLFNHVNGTIKRFVLKYAAYDLPPITINNEDALSSIQSLTSAVEMTGRPVFLLIDEYDNFANEVMMSVERSVDHYEALVKKEGILKTVFKNIKASASGSMFDRIFITGVSPVVMSDMTSGFNIGENVYLEPEYNDLCGFTEAEIHDIVEKMRSEISLISSESNKVHTSEPNKDYTCESSSEHTGEPNKVHTGELPAQKESLPSNKSLPSDESLPLVEEIVNIMRLYYDGYTFTRNGTIRV